MDRAVAQQTEQGGHVGLELFGVLRSAGSDAVPDGAAAAEQEAKRAPQVEAGQPQPRRQQAFAPVGHGLGAVPDEQPTRAKAGERPGEMGAADRIEGGVHARAATVFVGLFGGETAHRFDEIAVAIVDCLRTKAFNHGHVRGRTGADGVQPEVSRQIEQRRTDRARGTDREDRCTRRQLAVAGEHLEGGQICQRDTDRLGRIDSIGDRHEEPRRPDRVLRVAADDAEVGHHLAFAWARYPWTDLVDDAHDVVAGGERHRSFVVRVAAAPDEDVSKAGAGGQDLDADLVATRFGQRRIVHQFHHFGAAELCDGDALPCHVFTDVNDAAR